MPKLNAHPTIEDIFSPLKAKSGINIKPENKGKFNATKKATGKSTEELTHSSNPVTKKRAIFAQNASKWHHAYEGAELDPDGFPIAKRAELPGRAQTTDAPDVAAWAKKYDPVASHYSQSDDGPKKNPWGVAANAVVGGLGLLDAIMPYGDIRKQTIVQPQVGYNDHPYGTGSQALMREGGIIANQIAEDKAGAPRHYYHADDDYYTNGGQFGGYREPQANQAGNLLVFDFGGEIIEDEDDNKLVFKKGGKAKGKYGYRVHQDATRNTPDFEDGGYIRKLNSKGKVIPNIMAGGGDISPEQRKSDFPYTQLWYEDGGVLPPQYGKDEDMNKLVFQEGGSTAPGFTGNMAARVATPSSSVPFRKGKRKAKNGDYLDAFNDNMLLTAEYAEGGEIGPGNQRSTNPDLHQAYLVDDVNYALTHPQAKRARPGTTPEETSLIQDAYLWGRRPDQLRKAPQDIITSYFGRPTSDAFGQMRQKLNNVGHGAGVVYNDTPDQTVRDKNLVQPASYASSMENGGEVSRIIPHALRFHYGGDAETISNNPYAGPTMEFKGPSHEEGGIGMSYGGKKVEVEGGETGLVDQEGDFNVMGNMTFPGTNTKFKSLSKKIADKENSATRKFNKGQKLMDEANPDDAYDYLRFNSGRALTIGSDMKLKALADAREKLSGIQSNILDTAKRMDIDPQDLSQGTYTANAKSGKKIKYDDGGSLNGGDDDKKPSRSDRNHNPGNIKYGTFAKAHGASGKDADGFAIFENDDVGLGAMKSLLQSKQYNNLPVNQAITKWTAGKPYQYDLGALNTKRVGDLSQDEFENVVSTMRKGEGTRYGVNTPKTTTPTTPTTITPNSPATASATYNPNATQTDRFKGNYYQSPGAGPLPDINVDNRRIPSSSRNNGLGFDQIAPEVYAVATNNQVPVPAQKYQPQLFQPYKVSFQDRINENNDTFSAISKQLDYNPNALAVLGAQKYSADNAVKAEEFRTNQAISEDITNKNTSLLNDAQYKNLQLADEQMVRQATARAKTKAQTQEALNSVSSKILQNNLENKKLQLYEGLFDYRLTDNDGDGKTDAFTYQGGPAQFNFSGIPALGGSNNDTRTKTIYDRKGEVKETQKTNMAPLDEQLKDVRLIQQNRKLYLNKGR